MKKHINSISLDKVNRLLNHGPTVLVSSRYDGVDNVMAVSWSCMLDFDPPKITVVLGKESKTRELIEKSGYFVIQIPKAAQVKLVYQAGHISLFEDPEKLNKCGITLFDMDNHNLPFVSGCSAWLVCRLVPEKYNQETYDLFIGEVLNAWADERIFQNDRWHFESADSDWKSLHYIAGGHFYTIGDVIDIEEGMPS